MRKCAIIFYFLFCFIQLNAQLKDIKIILPKELGFTYYEFAQFMPDEKYFVTTGNSLTVFNTETAEVVDEFGLTSGVKNLSVSPDGKNISITLNNELYIFLFTEQKLNLISRVQTADLLKGIPNGQYYSSVPVSISFFTDKADEMYVCIGSFTLVYNYKTKKVVSTHSFKLGEYVIHGANMDHRNAVLLAMTTGTSTSIIKQSLADLAQTTEILKDMGTPSKIRVVDSLMFCFASDKYFIMNLDNGNIVHEVRVPKIKYDKDYHYDKKFIDQLNKRPALSVPDTINFKSDEYVYDIDFLSKTGNAVYLTSKGLKFIDLKTKKAKEYKLGFLFNAKISKAGNRMIINGYSQSNSLRVFDPNGMKLIAERHALTTSIYTAKVSPNNRWLVTNSSSSAFIWDLNNFTKYAEFKDVSKKDSSSISGIYFLNDSQLVVNSGTGMKNNNLMIYDILKKQYTRTIKKGVYSFASGFMNNEFYYCDHASLHIINLKTSAEEKYDGLFSLAASSQYQLINFTDQYVFVPESGKYKIIDRKTKKAEYESTSWSPTSRVIISSDNKFVFTTSTINTKKQINGNEIELQTNAIVRIDMDKKQVAKDYAQTYFSYDFKIKDNGKKIGIWYIKYDLANYNDSVKEALYTLYDIETAQAIYTKTLTQTKEIITSHHTSENGKYFSLDNYQGNYLKIFNEQGEQIMDLSYMNITLPNMFFNENSDQLIITSSSNPLATFVDLKEKKVIGQLANANNDQYFLVTSDLYYLGSKEFIKSIRFKYQSEIFSFEQFDAYLNQPHKVLKAFGCKDTSMIKAYETAYKKRMRLLGFKPDGTLSFSNLPSILSLSMKDDKPNFVKFDLSANKGKNKLAKIEVYNNGTLVHSQPIRENQTNKFDAQLIFETSSGINRFEFILKDEFGFESPRITRYYNNTSIVKPNLYLVVIASEKFKNNKYDLSYAVKDASDMANLMANSKSFNKIEVKKMFNQSFSNDSLAALNGFFSKANINDVVMVFFAGHGYLDEDLSYYFPTYYTDFSDPKINSIAYKSFEEMFKNMKPIRKLMFIDACFSGEVDEDDYYETEGETEKKDTARAVNYAGSTFAQSTALEMSKAVFSDLRQSSGATIISSAGGTEAAFEGEKWNNGLFTHCVLEGISNFKADRNSDKKVTLSELQKYVSEEVYKLSNGKQSPTYRMENTFLDYELW